MKGNLKYSLCLLLVCFYGLANAQFAIVRTDRHACILDSTGKKLDSLKIPKMSPDIRFAVDSVIVVSVHATGDTVSFTDKGYMLMFYSMSENKLKSLFNYQVTTMDAEEMKRMQIKLGQNSILLNNGSIFNNTFSIPVRTCIRKPELLKMIRMVGTK
ncbi:MAG: hypothetical protein K0S32_338 [Bacteroidetes bacterium]|jgi:hypothetical protein|nr:hypothetical protein [Bacteroidota bacterium]